jgi:hypothetical protein
MTKLRLGPIPDDRPVRITITLSATLHARMEAYAAALGDENGQRVEMVKMIPHMLERFIASDRAFARRRRQLPGHDDLSLNGRRSPSSSSSDPPG